jgi:hypothetical protein
VATAKKAVKKKAQDVAEFQKIIDKRRKKEVVKGITFIS